MQSREQESREQRAQSLGQGPCRRGEGRAGGGAKEAKVTHLQLEEEQGEEQGVPLKEEEGRRKEEEGRRELLFLLSEKEEEGA